MHRIDTCRITTPGILTEILNDRAMDANHTIGVIQGGLKGDQSRAFPEAGQYMDLRPPIIRAQVLVRNLPDEPGISPLPPQFFARLEVGRVHCATDENEGDFGTIIKGLDHLQLPLDRLNPANLKDLLARQIWHLFILKRALRPLRVTGNLDPVVYNDRF
jgi:hypothetical protein